MKITKKKNYNENLEKNLIEMTVTAAHKHDCWVGICGELGADTSLTETFLKMGIDELSVNPGSVLSVRKTIRSINLNK